MNRSDHNPIAGAGETTPSIEGGDATPRAEAGSGDRGCAFDGIAAGYDQSFSGRRSVRRLRRHVWKIMDRHLRKGTEILELGCGTGEDTLRFLQDGKRVTAVDASREMLRRAEQKTWGHRDRVRFLCMDLARLARENGSEEKRLGKSRFDAIFTNFGVLNCLPSLEPIHNLVTERLRAGGFLLAVLINRYYLRELCRGEFRRLRTSGSPVRCGKTSVRLYYHSPAQLEGHLTLRRLRLEALGVFGRSDIWSLPPFNRLGDHYLVLLERKAGGDS